MKTLQLFAGAGLAVMLLFSLTITPTSISQVLLPSDDQIVLTLPTSEENGVNVFVQGAIFPDKQTLHQYEADHLDFVLSYQ